MCPRTLFSTTYYERCLFSWFALLIVPLAPSWPHVYARHETYGFYRTGWPSPFQNLRKMHTFALGFPGGLCRTEPSGRHLGPILSHLGPIWMASWSISSTSSALLGRVVFPSFSFLSFFHILNEQLKICKNCSISVPTLILSYTHAPKTQLPFLPCLLPFSFSFLFY